ncbi:substrate-binding domain-containing protein [Reinekea marinisedimentorum]|uniref:Phosphate transport system substrate-binding protein n=1 Tax=Reinekea marinisedimentorum TaxID=230495 RepID=A0A4R3ID25_9GAMM|nr:substrate-binding domain-containing protein [Reinekea marinisedimentorum]TCS42545.1 phosphate transport system substrate-binding protein [Reinekea marinisedimentorum]
MKKVMLLLLALLPALSISSDLLDTNLTTNERDYLFEIHGSNTIGAELAPALLMRWMQSYNFTDVRETLTAVENEKEISGTSPAGQRVKVFVAAHGSSTGFKQVNAGVASLAAASRPAKTSENELFPGIDITDYRHETVVAIDGLAVVVNPNLPVDELTVPQVGELFSGEIKNWKELGGPDLPVSVHARDDRSGTYDTFATLVLKRGYRLTGSAKRYESNEVLANTVAMQPGAIGFTAFATVNNAKPVKIKDGNADATLPTESTIATEDYPLSRRLYLYQPVENNEYAAEFLKFVKGEVGQNVVAETGFISQNLKKLNMEPIGTLPTGYSFVMEQSLRVTTNFRFKPDSNDLDNKALDDINRLVEFMSQPENQGKKLILVGFSNKQRDEFKARVLSEARVMKVKHELGEVEIEASAMTGYGEIKPVATNEDIQYALRNQRVEVWLR